MEHQPRDRYLRHHPTDAVLMEPTNAHAKQDFCYFDFQPRVHVRSLHILLLHLIYILWTRSRDFLFPGTLANTRIELSLL